MDPLDGKTVAIVGLGLMGGSLALALRSHPIALVGIETDSATRELALEYGLVDMVTANLAEGVAGADLVVLAAPVGVIVSTLATLPSACPTGCAVLDLGSTKQAIVAAMNKLPPSFKALGGHPMCGKETAGLRAADAGLYQGQTFILSRTTRSDSVMENLAVSFVAAIGARPLWLEPGEHDRLVALTSHLPYFVAVGLIAKATTAAQANKHLWRLSASGFRDTTRLAGSDPLMLRDITATNRVEILSALRDYAGVLEEIIKLLEQGDDELLLDWLIARQREHDRYRQEQQRSSAGTVARWPDRAE
jgi:prephenate dehydrogenase